MRRGSLLAAAVLLLLSFPLFSQALPIPGFNQAYRDGTGYWGACPMGTDGCPDRIETAGCLITALASVLEYYRITLTIPAYASCTGAARAGMDPGILNDWLREHGGYGRCAEDRIGNCCLEWTAVPDEVRLYQHENLSSTGLDEPSQATIDRALAQGYPVIAGVHWGAYCHGTTRKSENCHWIVLTGKVGETYTITDPYNRDKHDPRGVRTTLNRGTFGAYTIDRFVVAEGPVPRAGTETRISVSLQDEKALVINLTGSGGRFLVFARAIDPQGTVSYVHLSGGRLLLSPTRRSLFPAPVELHRGKNELPTGGLPGAIPGSYTLEVWIETPERPGIPVAADIISYRIETAEAPESPPIVLSIGIAAGLALVISLLVGLIALAVER